MLHGTFFTQNNFVFVSVLWNVVWFKCWNAQTGKYLMKLFFIYRSRSRSHFKLCICVCVDARVNAFKHSQKYAHEKETNKHLIFIIYLHNSFFIVFCFYFFSPLPSFHRCQCVSASLWLRCLNSKFLLGFCCCCCAHRRRYRNA